jgi:predicted Kef-type K+ transport protein
MLVGLPAMALLGWFGFGSLVPFGIAVIGLIFGILLRRQIVDSFERLAWALPAALFAYGVALFIGDRLGLSKLAQISVITAVTVIAFNIQFWSLSDPEIVKTSDD